MLFKKKKKEKRPIVYYLFVVVSIESEPFLIQTDSTETLENVFEEYKVAAVLNIDRSSRKLTLEEIKEYELRLKEKYKSEDNNE